jgi:hypothetical protein
MPESSSSAILPELHWDTLKKVPSDESVALIPMRQKN